LKTLGYCQGHRRYTNLLSAVHQHRIFSAQQIRFSAGKMHGVRITAIYDIHGNLPALEAVLQDIRQALS
jgi:hypothetical protein